MRVGMVWLAAVAGAVIVLAAGYLWAPVTSSCGSGICIGSGIITTHGWPLAYKTVSKHTIGDVTPGPAVTTYQPAGLAVDALTGAALGAALVMTIRRRKTHSSN